MTRTEKRAYGQFCRNLREQRAIEQERNETEMTRARYAQTVISMGRLYEEEGHILSELRRQEGKAHAQAVHSAAIREIYA